MDFDKRLKKAIERGEQTGNARGRAQHERALGEDELRTLHSQYRLELSEHIEECLKKLADHFPGFRCTPLYGDEGWGAAVGRDDVGRDESRRMKSYYSRLEMLIRPFSSVHILELSAKGTIRNREVINRTHYQNLSEVDPAPFKELIDMWVLDYAEAYAATSGKGSV